MSDLKERVAKALGWSLVDVNSISMQGLREVVRQFANRPDLVAEMDHQIRSGEYIRGTPLKKPRRAHAKMGRHGYENGQRVIVLDYLGKEIGPGRVRSGDNYPESDEHFTWVTMTRAGETITEQWPTPRVIEQRR
jgi:hypothetical protein